jgi:transcriptional regulator with XRE-family HTH domain
MALKDVIKEARVKQNLKQDDAAEMVGVPVQTYSKWENGKTEPKASQVSKLAEIFGLSEKEICSGIR